MDALGWTFMDRVPWDDPVRWTLLDGFPCMNPEMALGACDGGGQGGPTTDPPHGGRWWRRRCPAGSVLYTRTCRHRRTSRHRGAKCVPGPPRACGSPALHQSHPHARDGTPPPCHHLPAPGQVSTLLVPLHLWRWVTLSAATQLHGAASHRHGVTRVPHNAWLLCRGTSRTWHHGWV